MFLITRLAQFFAKHLSSNLQHFIRFLDVSSATALPMNDSFRHVFTAQIFDHRIVQFAYFTQASLPPPHSLFIVRKVSWGTPLRSWLRNCATSRKVAGSIPMTSLEFSST